MKIKIIINSLLIIFILHILLENIDINYQIGDLNFENYNNKYCKKKINKNDSQTLKCQPHGLLKDLPSVAGARLKFDYCYVAE